jgi:hypothetical protein
MVIYMEMSPGNYIAILHKQKCVFFFFKNREQKGKADPVWGGWYQWEGKDEGKGSRWVNMMEILCTHACKRKNESH